MNPLFREIRHNPMRWMLVIVTVVLAAGKVNSGAPTVLFVLSVLAIVLLTILLSHATDSFASKTGDPTRRLLTTTLTASLVTSDGQSA